MFSKSIFKRRKHLSDLQFGDRHFQKNLAEAFDGVLKKFLKDNSMPSFDLLIISGDIAYDGSPNQYIEAKDWITNLCKTIFPTENFKDRILIVPGNHDANLSLCSLNNFKYHFPKSEKEEGSDKIEMEPRDTPERVNDYTLYSLDPFRDFAYSLTKE